MPTISVLRPNIVLSLIAFAVIGCSSATSNTGAAAKTPAQVADELLAADRGFAAASAQTDLISGISAMFAPDVTMPIPGGKFANNATEAIAALRANPDNPTSKITWTPVRAGVSADGLHGFTYGYVTATKADNTQAAGKYLSYWVKGPQGWRVAVYKRALRAAGEVSLAMVAPALPPSLKVPSSDESVIAPFRETLGAAERAFSDEAQKIGLGPAFAKYGSDDAVNMGGPQKAEFVRGAAAIGNAVSGGTTEPSPVSWGPDKVIVASSGDFGVTIGFIRPNQQPPGQTTAFPFFTIWRRDSVSQPWRYVAE